MRVAGPKATPRRGPIAWVFCGLWALLLLDPMAQATYLDLSAYRGEGRICGFLGFLVRPLQQSFPWLDSLVREYEAQHLFVIGVNVDKDRDAEQFLNETPADFAILYDPKGDLATAYKVTGMPCGISLGTVLAHGSLPTLESARYNHGSAMAAAFEDAPTRLALEPRVSIAREGRLKSQALGLKFYHPARAVARVALRRRSGWTCPID